MRTLHALLLVGGCLAKRTGSSENVDDGPQRTRSLLSYACSYATVGTDVVLNFSGDRATTENLRMNGGWKADVTGLESFTANNVVDPHATFEVRLRGMGYTVGSDGFTTVSCVANDDSWNLVWEDHFDGGSVDTRKWQVFEGAYGTPYRSQTYTAANVRVEQGSLFLGATFDGEQYWSGMVTTNNVDLPENTAWAKGNLGWTFGRFEIRARLPHGFGLWPALWMRPLWNVYSGPDGSNKWPANGEIDIMEYIGPGNDPGLPNAPVNQLVQNAHYYGSDGTKKQQKNSFQVTESEVQNFHIFGLEWEESALRFYFDGVLVHSITDWESFNGGPTPFNQHFDIIMNLQVGGWAGPPDPAYYPAEMEIDWVKVFEVPGAAGPEPTPAPTPAPTPEEPGGPSTAPVRSPIEPPPTPTEEQPDGPSAAPVRSPIEPPPTQPVSSPSEPAPESGSATAPPSCFSAHNNVEIRGKGWVSMDTLQIGDFVRVADGTFSRVYSFAHNHGTLIVEYLQIFVRGMEETPLEISPEHMLFVDRKPKTSKPHPVPAGHVQVGDHLFTTGAAGISAEVVNITAVHHRGAYAPYTERGNMIVAGVVVSNYVTATERVMPFSAEGWWAAEHWLQNALNAPHRIVCRLYFEWCKQETYDEKQGYSNWIVPQLKLAEWFAKRNGGVQSVLLYGFGAPLLFIVLWLEKILSPLVRPLLLCLALAGYLCTHWVRKHKMCKLKKC